MITPPEWNTGWHGVLEQVPLQGPGEQRWLAKDQ